MYLGFSKLQPIKVKDNIRTKKSKLHDTIKICNDFNNLEFCEFGKYIMISITYKIVKIYVYFYIYNTQNMC
jgi:hypothetical protein